MLPATDMARHETIGQEASAPKVPLLHLPAPAEAGLKIQRPSGRLQKKGAKGNAAGVNMAEGPSAFSIPAWRDENLQSPPPLATDLKPCSTCGRTFNAQALAIHARICTKVALFQLLAEQMLHSAGDTCCKGLRPFMCAQPHGSTLGLQMLILTSANLGAGAGVCKQE